MPFQLLISIHPSLSRCDACNMRIVGIRVICLDCGACCSGGTMDFCSDERCYSKVVDREDPLRSHQPTHKLLKVRTSLRWYEENRTPDSEKGIELPYSYMIGTDSSKRIQESIDLLSPHHQCCSVCSAPVGQPTLFWRCTVCTGEASSFSIIRVPLS